MAQAPGRFLLGDPSRPHQATTPRPTAFGVMWRAAGVSYLRYSNEMASILRQCLKEPYREKAIARDAVHIVEKTWANGVVQMKTVHEDMGKAFEAASGSAEAKK
uniref:ATP synthase subunit epsilon, mitochondrial n=1 Tax=Alexandrium monilatum TaxID=311494 RepID=A0A7S4Q818_9DINO